MGFADIHGRASVNPKGPKAFAACDQCGNWYNRVDLRVQFEWVGNRLVDLGYRVCRTCQDKPQAQFRTPILPTPDPAPIINARPDFAVAALKQFGFTLFALQPPLVPGDFLNGQLVADAASIAQAKTDVLAAVATLSRVATPAGITDRSSTIAAQGVAQQLVAANAVRSWITIYNPTDVPMAVSTGQAAFGARSSVILGAGSALFWATAQGLGAPWAGAMTVIAQFAGSPFWVWDK